MDALPGLSQLKSLVQLAAGDKKGAKETQENFITTCPVFSQLKSVCQLMDGDRDGAIETQKRCLTLLDPIPGVGHVKGIVHYAAGDKDGGDDAMKAASRTCGVMAGGVVGAVVGGPAGAVAGGMVGGVTADGVITKCDSANRPYGHFQHMVKIRKSNDPAAYLDAVILMTLDGLTGYGTCKFMQKTGIQISEKTALATTASTIKMVMSKVYDAMMEVAKIAEALFLFAPLARMIAYSAEQIASKIRNAIEFGATIIHHIREMCDKLLILVGEIPSSTGERLRATIYYIVHAVSLLNTIRVQPLI